jgi:hypothetical protein
MVGILLPVGFILALDFCRRSIIDAMTAEDEELEELAIEITEDLQRLGLRQADVHRRVSTCAR